MKDNVEAEADGSREWWQLNVAEAEQRALGLVYPRKLIFDDSPRLYWTNGSTVRYGSRELTRADVMTLVDEVAREIAARGINVARMPDLNSVRRGTAIEETLTDSAEPQVEDTETEMLVVDFEFHDYFIPVGASVERLSSGSSFAQIACSLVRELASVLRYLGDDFFGREVRMREMLLDAAAKSGGGMVPLWLRPIPWDPLVYDSADPRYDVATLQLDRQLEWKMTWGRVRCEGELSYYYAVAKAMERRRTHRAIVDETGYGLDTDVALAFVNDRSIDPAKMFNDLRTANFAGDFGVLFSDGSTSERLILDDGVIELLIAFEGGTYTAGKLSLYGDYPLLIQAAAKGMRLAELAEHPAFIHSGVVVEDCTLNHGTLELLHEVRTVPIAQAISENVQGNP